MRRRPPGQKLAAPLIAVLRLWRGRAGGLAFGVVVSMLAFGFGLGLLGVAGFRLAGASVGMLLISAWLLRGLGIGRVLLRYAERLLTHAATFRALADLRVWFFRRLAGSAAGGLGFRRTGDALSRLVGDVEVLDGLYLRLLLPLAAVLMSLPLLAVMLGAAQPALACAVCLLFASSALLLPWIAARRSAASGSALAASAAGLRVAVLDLVTGLREIRAFGAETRSIAVVEERERALLGAQAALSRRGALAGAAAFLIGQAAVLCVLAAALGLGFGRIPATAAVLFLFVLLAAFEVSSGLVRAGVLAGSMANSASRVLEAEQTLRPAPAGGASAWPRDLTVRFEAVHFRWQPERPAVFDGLSLTIPSGARIALLGASGSGKSTLAALLLRVAVPQSGRVSVGGIDLDRLDEAALRSHLAWLGQESHLFDDSIRNNLLLGRPEASEPELWSALEQAHIADLVRSLPEGLDCWLGESGARVSGGQGRRLALARALLSDAPILILDEPTAGLDADTERDFFRTLNELEGSRSIILIVHRLTGVERLDRIWRLEHGKAVAAS